MLLMCCVCVCVCVLAHTHILLFMYVCRCIHVCCDVHIGVCASSQNVALPVNKSSIS